MVLNVFIFFFGVNGCDQKNIVHQSEKSSGINETSTFIDDIDFIMKNHSSDNEIFNVLYLGFVVANVSGDPWFYKSSIRFRLNPSIERAIKLAADNQKKITWKNNVERENLKFYDKLALIKSQSNREDFLKNFTVIHNSNILIFGRYWGDDYNMTLRLFMYNSNRNTVVSKETVYQRNIPEDELINATNNLIRDLFLQNLEGTPKNIIEK